MGILENKFLLPIISLLLGAVLTTIVNKILNKTKTIFYSVNTDRVALSSDDPVFGNVHVEWQGHKVNNLYNTVIEVENTTSIDYKDLELKVWSGKDVLILNERTSIVDTTRLVEWSNAYKEKMVVPTGGEATQEQINIYHHERIYKIDVFNRGQKLQFTYLSTLINHIDTHWIWLELIYPGLKFKQRFATNKIHNVLVTDALFWGLIASFATVVLSSLYIEKTWIIAIFCIIVGLIAQSIGAYIYKTIAFIRNLIIR